VKSRWLQADGTYRRRKAPKGEPLCRAQEILYDQARRAATLARERTGVTFRPERAEPID
jgi:hypothetical protein